jgi:hypothetical protein
MVDFDSLQSPTWHLHVGERFDNPSDYRVGAVDPTVERAVPGYRASLSFRIKPASPASPTRPRSPNQFDPRSLSLYPEFPFVRADELDESLVVPVPRSLA